ncbi:hypothetical protein RchiOBHm_Chr1g0336501 [Rosa chinensis]|uniref:Uncharacterized protein n=1 Tax=Rosa chinensis TaxID=74649 RepID=A0A2P6SCN6_ROSCH|nr:hypothetical protein RchiOBHm_Chr1g0336501 [Rosa chinensis]
MLVSLLHMIFLSLEKLEHRCDCLFEHITPEPIRIALSSYQGKLVYCSKQAWDSCPKTDAASYSVSFHSRWIPALMNAI